MIYLPIISLAFIGEIIIILSAKDVIFRKSVPGRTMVTRAGYWIFMAIIIQITLIVLQNNIQQIDQDKRENKLRKSNADSVRAIVSIISENLGKYGYAFDSVTKGLKKLIMDSSKTRVLESEPPTFYIGDNGDKKGLEYLGAENNKYNYQINFRSLDAGISRFELKFSIVVLDTIKGYLYVGDEKPFNNKEYLAKNALKSEFFWVVIPNYDELFLWIRGIYKNIDGSKTYHFDQVISNKKKNNICYIIMGGKREKIIETVNASLKK